MKNLYFDDFEDLACDIADTYDSLKCEDFEDVVIVAKYEEARQIIKELICIGYDIHSLEIHDELWENYNSEFIISLYDNELWCEPMLRENGYIYEESPVMYVLDNCSSKVIPYCKGKTVYEVTVGDDDCGCDECECYECDNRIRSNDIKCHETVADKLVEYSKDDDGDLHGFSVSKGDGNSFMSYSLYTSDKLSLRDIQSLMQEKGF